MRWIVIAGMAGACGDNLQVFDAPVPADTARDTVPADTTLPGDTTTPVAILRVSPTMSVFPLTQAHHISAPIAFVVTNEGAAASGMIQKLIDGADASYFAIVSDGCTAPLDPQASCTIELAFMAPASGTKSARLVVVGTPGGETTATLGGTSASHEYIVAAPSMQDYGDVQVGQSGVQEFAIINAGGLSTSVLSTSIVGNDPTQFAISGIDTCTGMTVPPADDCMFSVTFSPTTAGMKTAVIEVTQSAGVGVTVGVLGNATP